MAAEFWTIYPSKHVMHKFLPGDGGEKTHFLMVLVQLSPRLL